MGRRLGLVIGVNRYQDYAFRPLQFAETDARALAQWLVNVRGGNWNPSDFQVLLGAQATRELAESLISQVCLDMAGPEDLILIYFAGHAFLDERSGEGYLALANTIYQQPSTGIHLLSMISYVVGRSRAAQAVVLLDCFQTGARWSMQRTSSYDFRPLLGPSLLTSLQQGGPVILCSCRGNELAPEVGEKNLGMLMHRMILGMSGQAMNHGDTINGEDTMNRDAINRVPTGQLRLRGLQTFLSNNLDAQHRPQVFGQEKNAFVLVGDVASSQSRSMQLLYSARQMVQVQNIAEAFSLVDQSLQLASTNIDALILKGQLLGASGRYQEALAVVERVVQLDANNALAWSMRAALLTNMGRHSEALPAVERALALDPGNAEALAIKGSILNNLEWLQYSGNRQGIGFAQRKRGGPLSFFIGTCLQFFALLIGVVGAALPILSPQSPILVTFLLESLGLAILVVNAARGAYLYGFMRLALTLFTSLVAIGILGALYKFGYSWLQHKVINSPPLLVPILFLGAWLILAGAAPLIVAIGGFIGGLVVGVRRR